MAIRAAIREPQRPLLFALAVLIHVGLFQLLAERAAHDPRDRPSGGPCWCSCRTRRNPARAALQLRRLLRNVCRNVAAREHGAAIDRSARNARQHPRRRSSTGSARRRKPPQARARSRSRRDPKDDSGPSKPKPEFGWVHSRTHRSSPWKSGGFVVWINDRCAVVDHRHGDAGLQDRQEAGARRSVRAHGRSPTAGRLEGPVAAGVACGP